MNKPKIIIMGTVGHGISLSMQKLALQRNIELIDVKTASDLHKKITPEQYYHQMLAYKKS